MVENTTVKSYCCALTCNVFYVEESLASKPSFRHGLSRPDDPLLRHSTPDGVEELPYGEAQSKILFISLEDSKGAFFSNCSS